MNFRVSLATCLVLSALVGAACRSEGQGASVRESGRPAEARPDVDPPDSPDPTPPPGGDDALDVLGEVVAVWLQDRGDGRDTLARGSALVPIAWDSAARTERPLVSAPGSYAKPLVLPGGRAFLFSDRQAHEVWHSKGPGTTPVRLGAGVALATWRDPASRDWVIVGREPTAEDPAEYRRLERFPLDSPGSREPLPLRGVVNEDNFQVAADGQLAGGVFPWPHVGWFDLTTGTPQPVAEGCWGGLAPLPQALLCYLDGAHRRMTVVPRSDPDRRWGFTFDAIPALRGHEIYHPRWTSHPRAMLVTGPYVAGDGPSAVRAGGTGVDVYLVLLNASLTGVERWSRLSTNQHADFYPDAWVATAGTSPGVAPVPGPTSSATAGPTASTERVVVEARLATIAATPSLRAIAPYTQALVAGRYEVTRVIEGTLSHASIAVAHWVIRERRAVADSTRTPGRSFRLTLEPYARHGELEGERLVMAPDAAALPLYYDVSSE